MTCPHCSVAVHHKEKRFPLFASLKVGSQKAWEVWASQCPSCYEPILRLAEGKPDNSNGRFQGVRTHEGMKDPVMIWPKLRAISPHVPPVITADFKEADLLLATSAKASAALSRRCLERVLHAVGGAKSQQLVKAIDEASSQPGFPSPLKTQLEATKEIGNFAAHPRKDTNSGEIFDVEPEEAELTLKVLEDLFDHYYVKPATTQILLDSLNRKLLDAGKKTIT